MLRRFTPDGAARHFQTMPGWKKLSWIRAIVGDPRGIKWMSSRRAEPLKAEWAAVQTLEHVLSIISAVEDAVSGKTIVLLHASALDTNPDILGRILVARWKKNIPVYIDWGTHNVEWSETLSIKTNLLAKVIKALGSKS